MTYRLAPRQNSPRPDMRDYSSLKNRGERPSAEFDWEKALYLQALSLRELGYELTTEQQKRIDDHD